MLLGVRTVAALGGTSVTGKEDENGCKGTANVLVFDLGAGV